MQGARGGWTAQAAGIARCECDGAKVKMPSRMQNWLARLLLPFFVAHKQDNVMRLGENKRQWLQQRLKTAWTNNETKLSRRVSDLQCLP